jgi:hypothetical protein
MSLSDRKLGVTTVRERRPATQWRVISWLVGLAWPPIPLTLVLFPPVSWIPKPEGDWRIAALIVAAMALALTLWRIGRDRAAGRGPTTRLGVVWRFVLYGVLFGLAAQALALLSVMIMGWLGVSGVPQGLGVAETSFLLFGVGLLPVTVVAAISWAVWAGLATAFILFESAPAPVKRPAHLMGGAAD